MYLHFVLLNNKHNELEKLEEEKREKYNPDNIFKNRNKEEIHIKQNSNLPVEMKKEKFFAKLINFIKNIFKF